jgi:hypothetical protein
MSIKGIVPTLWSLSTTPVGKGKKKKMPKLETQVKAGIAAFRLRYGTPPTVAILREELYAEKEVKDGLVGITVETQTSNMRTNDIIFATNGDQIKAVGRIRQDFDGEWKNETKKRKRRKKA